MTAGDLERTELAPAGFLALVRRPLVIDADGVTVGKRRTRWEDIGYYRCRWSLAAISQLQLVSDRAVISLDSSYHGWRDGADQILEQLHPHLADNPRDFRPFDLDEAALHHPVAGALPLHELEGVHVSFVAEPLVTVIRRPDTDWAYCDLADIHNPFWFLQTLSLLGVRLDAAGPVRLPAAVAELRAHFATPTSLPRAIVRAPRR